MTIEQILAHPWTTKNGEFEVDVENEKVFKYGKDGFGNLSRYLMLKTLGRKSHRNLSNNQLELDPVEESKQL